MQSENRTSHGKAYAQIFLGIVLLGTGPMFVKFVRANGTLVAFYRLLFAAGMLAVPAMLAMRKTPVKKPIGKHSGWLIAGGAAYAVNIALWCTALNYTSAAIVTVLDTLAPVWVGIFSWLVLGSRQERLYWIGLCLAIGGGALLAVEGAEQGGATHPLGVLLSVISGVTYAAYILATQKARKHHSSLTYSWMVAVIGAVVLFVFALASGAFSETLSTKSYLLILMMSLTSQVLGWYLVNEALGNLPAAAGAVALVGQPVVTMVLGIFILGELLTAGQWMGAVLCLAGILLAQRKGKPA